MKGVLTLLGGAAGLCWLLGYALHWGGALALAIGLGLLGGAVWLVSLFKPSAH